VSWSSRPLTPLAAGNNYRPVVPRGQRGDGLHLVWMHGSYPSYTRFHTSLRTQARTPTTTPAAAAWTPTRLDMLAAINPQPHHPAPSFTSNRNRPLPLDLTTTTITSTTTVMADPNPRSTPIPITKHTQTAD
jgi:hypothetical protein